MRTLSSVSLLVVYQYINVHNLKAIHNKWFTVYEPKEVVYQYINVHNLKAIHNRYRKMVLVK